jgi:tRNA1(Val) A37 N6-methylase TrmN6
MKTSRIKANGVHYTPPELAGFLAAVTAEWLANCTDTIRVLDPACGSGALLRAFALALPAEIRHRLILVGYETDELAIAQATASLRELHGPQVQLLHQDFLAVCSGISEQRSLFGNAEDESLTPFDVVIANPPYVRTQVLGSAKSKALAQKFGLTGRVDLYHAFAKGMAGVLKPGGVLGLLTSNRFLTVKSGATLRDLLTKHFAIRSIYDLGDTKLFAAAVLPVIVVATRSKSAVEDRPCFHRVYQYREAVNAPVPEVPSLLQALRDTRISGLLQTPSGVFKIERGYLSHREHDRVWALATKSRERFLATVARKRRNTFHDVARIRVGIKTTADEVFIRQKWSDVAAGGEPEAELLRPLIRHGDARRWHWSGHPGQSVLYPHVSAGRDQRPIDLRRFPRGRRYLEAHRERLTRRHYLIEGGREWYEIWVPHRPHEWSLPKVVFPDIAENAKFFLDTSGAIVNGDCYWITLRDGVDADYLLLLLAVANSSFAARYYDIAFHNKLYAGRRRFMTQYVKQFPLPDLNCSAARKAIRAVAKLVSGDSVEDQLESEVDALVWQAFGLDETTGSAPCQD